MGEKNKLYIVISDEREGGEGGTSTPTKKAKEEKEKDDTLGRYVEHQVFHLVKQQATKFAYYTLGNIGNFSGDYIMQDKVNSLLESSQGFMNIGMATAYGAKAGGWIGAIVGFVVGAGAETISSAYQIHSKTVEVTKQNYEIEQIRARSGLNSLKDGSRGTEN